MDNEFNMEDIDNMEEIELLLTLEDIFREFNNFIAIFFVILTVILESHLVRDRTPRLQTNPLRQQIDYLNRLVSQSDVICVDQLRVDRHCFMCLCHLLTV